MSRRTVRTVLESRALYRWTLGLPVRASGGPTTFVHIPKCAGTSIATSFRIANIHRREWIARAYDPRIPTAFGHLSIAALIAEGDVSADSIRKTFTFTVVRNPYARAVSLFRFQFPVLQDYGLVTSLPATGPTPDGLTRYLETVASDRPPVGLKSQLGISVANPQSDWMDGIQFNLIARFERLGEAIPEIVRGMQLRREPGLLRLNVTQNGADRLLNEDAIALIRGIYARDFALLGYSEDPPPELTVA